MLNSKDDIGRLIVICMNEDKYIMRLIVQI